MHFSVVRTSDANCEPNCPEWIAAEGKILTETIPLFNATLQALGGRKLPLVLFSRGGDLDTAMALGRVIRRNGLDVAIGRADFKACRPGEPNCKPNDAVGELFFGQASSPGGYCASECLLMLASGTKRFATMDTIVGVTQMHVPSEVAAYLQEMGVDPSLLDLMRNAPARVFTVLTTEEMRKTSLITGTPNIEVLTGDWVCRSSAIANNCRLIAGQALGQ
jgi:hypothetical protein